MRIPSLAGILVFGFLIGGILSFFGVIIKYFNVVDIINLYDEKKHDKDKVLKVFGRNFILVGISEITISLISIFINEIYYGYIILFLGFIVISGMSITFYQFFTRCKNTNNDK
ncbi:DUF3784 domain-containing protein [Clostridium massiliodielmoense]|uniref:DUF3784 domain-containing protein n=1 Tax=Clostridium massiliodielmoense TaxID=1776385 RepID=UPI000A272832|nr:DUF3784 domain-containing protein [Clostridium massiliodielmoense]